MTRKPAVGYVRVSTSGQADFGVSLDAQADRIRAWCRDRGHPLGADSIHVDRGISGKRADNRPALRAALAEVCGDGGVLVVYSLSRLARSTVDTFRIAADLDRARADLVSVTESIDTTSASGKMIFGMLSVLAEFERNLTAERTAAAVAHKRARGERIGQVPFGKALGPDGRTLVDDPVEAEVVGRMRAMRAGGMSNRAIARELDALGIGAKRSGKWSHQAVKGIIGPAEEPGPSPTKGEA